MDPNLVSLLFTEDIGVQLILFSEILNQYSYGISGPYSELIYYDGTTYECWIGSSFILVHKGVLVISQGFIRDNEQGL